MPLFDFVKSNLSVLDVISEYVRLKPAGSYWKGACPFHSEKDASFTVSPDKQIFYCFGCHSGGDLIAFIAKIESLTQLEALNFLIDRYNLEVPEHIKKTASKQLSGQSKENKRNFFELCSAVAEYANKNLLLNGVALKYLNDRDISEKEIKHFNVGYFSSGPRFINSFVKKMADRGVLVKDLLEVGVLMEGRSVLYSPFEERILFPIKDSVGRFCGFGGRIFNDSDQRAKYYNSKESAWFSKGKLLFGLDLAKKEMQTKNFAFLVEGYTDCVAMTKYGHLNTIATLGTACTQDHLKLLARYINTLYVLYDGDSAGQKAILRLTQLCWDVNLDLQIVKLPAKDDPASFLARNGDLDLLIKQSEDIFSFFIDSTGGQFACCSLSEKMELSQKVLLVIAKIDDAFKQELLLQRASQVMQIPMQTLQQQMVSLRGRDLNLHKDGSFDGKTDTVDVDANGQQKGVSLLEERIFSAIINSMDRAEKFFIEDDLISYFAEYVQFLLSKVKGSKDFNSFLDGLDGSDKDWVTSCSLKFESVESQDLFAQLIFHFCKQNWKKIVQDMKLKLFKANHQADELELQRLLSLFSKLKQGIQIRGLI